VNLKKKLSAWWSGGVDFLTTDFTTSTDQTPELWLGHPCQSVKSVVENGERLGPRISWAAGVEGAGFGGWFRCGGVDEILLH
jgi:hypothetical protein